MITVSHSELACFRSCPRKWSLRYRVGRVAKIVGEALAIGKRVDKALKGEPAELKPQERAMVDAHTARWASSSLVVKQQGVWFSAEISPGITLIGEFDAIGEQDGQEVVIERKTTSADIGPGSAYWRRILHVDPQLSLYLVARPTAKHVLYDVLRKPALRGRSGETDEQLYARSLSAITADPGKYMQRAVCVRFEEERKAHVCDVKGTVHLMMATPSEAPRNTDSCISPFGWECEYLSVCSGEANIDDDLRYEDRKATRRAEPRPLAKSAFSF